MRNLSAVVCFTQFPEMLKTPSWGGKNASCFWFSRSSFTTAAMLSADPLTCRKLPSTGSSCMQLNCKFQLHLMQPHPCLHTTAMSTEGCSVVSWSSAGFFFLFNSTIPQMSVFYQTFTAWNTWINLVFGFYTLCHRCCWSYLALTLSAEIFM